MENTAHQYVRHSVMERQLARAFAEGDLRPGSDIERLPYIGQYLGDRMRRAFLHHAGRRTLTIRGFVRAIGRETSANAAMDRIKRALQNDRGNQCVHNPRPYRIADVNTMGWRSIVALLRTVERVMDGGRRMGHFMRFDPRHLRLPTRRGHAAKRSGCVTRRECVNSRGTVYRDGLCMPRSSRARGFDGIGSHPGQKGTYRCRRSRQSRYVRHPSGESSWRRPSRRRQRQLRL